MRNSAYTKPLTTKLLYFFIKDWRKLMVNFKKMKFGEDWIDLKSSKIYLLRQSWSKYLEKNKEMQ